MGAFLLVFVDQNKLEGRRRHFKDSFTPLDS